MYNFKFKLEELNFENIIFSNIESRPSKTLVIPNIYNYFDKLKINELILYDIYNIENNKKDISYFLLNEIINKLKIENFNDFCFSFDNININEYDYYNIIFAFENNINQLSIIKNYINILEEIKQNDIVILNFNNLYCYSNLELMLIFAHCFNKFHIYFSKILKKDIIIFKKFIPEEKNVVKKLLLYLYKNINNNIYLKQCGFNIDNDIIKFIKNYNLNYMSYYIDLNYKISNLNLLNNENKLIEKYYLFNYFNKHKNLIKNCNHKFEHFVLHNCNICKTCFELFEIY